MGSPGGVRAAILRRLPYSSLSSTSEPRLLPCASRLSAPVTPPAERAFKNEMERPHVRGLISRDRSGRDPSEMRCDTLRYHPLDVRAGPQHVPDWRTPMRALAETTLLLRHPRGIAPLGEPAFIAAQFVEMLVAAVLSRCLPPRQRICLRSDRPCL